LRRIKKKRIILAKYSALVTAFCPGHRLINLALNLFSYFLRRSRVRGMPFLLQVEPTNRCNLNCRLCATGSGELKRPKGDMTFELFKKIVDQNQNNLAYLVLYNLGEPTLNPEIYNMIKYAKKKKIFTRLSTNANFKNRSHISNLLSSGLDEVIISLDCPTERTYAEYKGSDDFKHVIDNVRLLVEKRKNEAKPFINLQMLIMRQTEAEIAEFKRIVRDLGVDNAIMKKIRVDLLNSPPKFEFLPKNKKYIRDVYKKQDRTKSCWRPWFSTVIFWEGTVVPCCLDVSGKFSFGNINEKQLSLIWNEEKYIAFRKKIVKYLHSSFLCSDCSIRDFSSNFVK